MKKNFSKKESSNIASKLRVKFNKEGLEQFRKGLGVELEHGTEATKNGVDANITNNNPRETGKIALAHINEYPRYYDGLKKMEKRESKKSNLRAIIKKHLTKQK